jgi:hypothetical protein
MAQLMISSRKGLLQMDTLTGQILSHHFPGEAVSRFFQDPRDSAWYACLNLGHFGAKLHRSINQGASWQEISCPAFPEKPEAGFWADDVTPWSVGHVWCLAAGHVDEPGVLWAGCMPAGLFRSIDNGQTWQLIESLWLDERRKEWMGGGNDHPALHSILVDPRNAQHITVAISCGGIWTSFDAGATWTLIGAGQRATFLPEELAGSLNGQDPHRLVANIPNPDTHWISHHCGIFVSRDGSQHYQQLMPPAGYDFGFAVAVDPNNARRAWFVPAIADLKRYPINSALAVMRTDDGGSSFQLYRQGLPQQNCFDLVYRHSLVVDNSGQQLAMASTTGNLWSSTNAGESWQQLASSLPPVAALDFI